MARLMFSERLSLDYLPRFYKRGKVPCPRCLRRGGIGWWCKETDDPSVFHLQCSKCHWGWPKNHDLCRSDQRIYLSNLLRAIWAYGMTENRNSAMETLARLDAMFEQHIGLDAGSLRFRRKRYYAHAEAVWFAAAIAPPIDRIGEVAPLPMPKSWGFGSGATGD